MSKEIKVSNNGVSGMFLLFLLFLALKLTGQIGWSWLWVTAPLWGGLALVLVVMLFAVVVALVAAIRS